MYHFCILVLATAVLCALLLLLLGVLLLWNPLLVLTALRYALTLFCFASGASLLVRLAVSLFPKKSGA